MKNKTTIKSKTRTNKLNITTIKLERETKERLSRLKEYERETYDQVIKKILYILNEIRKDPISGNRFLGKIDSNIRRKIVYEKKTNNKTNKKSKLDLVLQ